MRPGQPIAQRLNQPALRSPADFRVNGRRPGILPDLVSTPRHPSPVAHNWPAASCVTHGPRNLDRLSLLGLGRVKLRRLGRQRRPADFRPAGSSRWSVFVSQAKRLHKSETESGARGARHRTGGIARFVAREVNMVMLPSFWSMAGWPRFP